MERRYILLYFFKISSFSSYDNPIHSPSINDIGSLEHFVSGKNIMIIDDKDADIPNTTNGIDSLIPLSMITCGAMRLPRLPTAIRVAYARDRILVG